MTRTLSHNFHSSIKTIKYLFDRVMK